MCPFPCRYAPNKFEAFGEDQSPCVPFLLGMRQISVCLSFPCRYAPNKFEAFGEEEIFAVGRCLRQGWLAPGPITAEFEKKVAESFGKKCGIMVNSGSSANLIAIAAHDFKEG